MSDATAFFVLGQEIQYKRNKRANAKVTLANEEKIVLSEKHKNLNPRPICPVYINVKRMKTRYKRENLKMMNFVKLAGITGLTALTAMASLGLGTVNVLADDAQLPAYVMNGTNAERAISDYFVNNFDRVNDGSVVIPHMDIMKLQSNGASVNVYGAYDVVEYTRNGSALVEDGASFASEGCFTLSKNDDGTFTVASYNEVGDDASKEDVTAVFGKGLSDEAFAIYCNGGDTELWNAVRASDVAYYSYDNNLGLDKIVERDDQSLSLAKVSFSAKDAHTMYVQTDANVRSAGTTAATAFDGFERGEDITVTGMANGWGRVTMNGRTGYISASLLGDSKPAKEEKKAEKKKEEKKQEQEQKAQEYETSYTVGRFETISGSAISVNGYTIYITPDTELEGGELKDGDMINVRYRVIDGEFYATSIFTFGDPMEDVAMASDGRVADTGNNYGMGYGNIEVDDMEEFAHVSEEDEEIAQPEIPLEEQEGYDPETELSPEEVEQVINSANYDFDGDEVYVEIEE